MEGPEIPVEVKCPFCNRLKTISIPEYIFEQKQMGTIKTQIVSGIVCDHTFIVFVDVKSKSIRGYEKIDLLMGRQDENIPKVSIKRIVDQYGLDCVVNLLHSKIFNYPVYILINRAKIGKADEVNLILDKILPIEYRDPFFVSYINEEQYNSLNEKENSLIIDSNCKILHAPWDEKLRYEENILKKALDIFDEAEQLIILEQEILRFIKEVNHITNLLINTDDSIHENEVIDSISKALFIPRIKRDRFYLLLDFIDRRISPDLTQKVVAKKRVKKKKALISIQK